jgi:y4mF family transcriptional regulator
MRDANQLVAKLGLIIKQQRLQRNLNQAQLASLARVSLNFISQIEAGKPRMQFVKLLQVLNVLGLQLKIEVGASGLVIEEKLEDQ